MESSKDMELLSQAIEKLLEEKRNREAAGETFVEDDDNQFLLSRLLSQVEAIKGKGALKEAEVLVGEDAISSQMSDNKAGGRGEDADQLDNRKKEVSTEELIKEIKKVRRQNTITHLLLSAMIVLTVTWQLSEFSVILRVKDGLSHPFKSFGNMLVGMLKRPAPPNDKLPEEGRNNHTEAPFIPSLNMPQLLHDLDFHSEE